MRISDWSSDVCSSDLEAGDMLFSDQRIAERVVLVIIFNERAGELLPLLDPEPLGERAGRDVAHDHLDRHDFHLPHKLFAHVEAARSEEHTSELHSLMRISYAVVC